MCQATYCCSTQITTDLKTSKDAWTRRSSKGNVIVSLPLAEMICCLAIYLFYSWIDCLSVYCSGILPSMPHFLWIVTKRCCTWGMGSTRWVKKKNFEIRYSKLVGLRNTVCRTTFSSCSSRYYAPNRYVLVQQNAHLKRKRFFSYDI